jgi:hypothetical protein
MCSARSPVCSPRIMKVESQQVSNDDVTTKVIIWWWRTFKHILSRVYKAKVGCSDRGWRHYNQSDQVNHKLGRARRTHWEKRNAYRILVKTPHEKRPLGRPRRRSEDNTEIESRETKDGMVWTGLILLVIGTSGGLLWTRWWTFGFYKLLGSSWVAAQLVASQEGLSSVNK